MNIFSRREVCTMVTPSTIDSRARRAACWLRSACGRDDDEREYALIIVLIAIVVIVLLQVVGQQVNNVFSNVSNGLSA
jgi:hypothetical protein